MREKNITQDSALYFKDFEEDINKAIHGCGAEEFSEAKSWWTKLGLKVDIAEKEMMNAIVENLSKQLTNGLFQLTIEEIINKKECKDAIRGKYLFSWDEIPGNDSVRLKDFLKQRYNIDWVKASKIEKIGDGKTVKVFGEKNYLSLRLNNEKTKLNLKIDDGRTDEFIASSMNGKLNIYQGKKDQTIVMRLRRKLSPFKIYVEFLVKSGLMEIKKIRYDFRAEPTVEIKDIKVNIQGNKIKNIFFGPFIASITLSLLKGENAVKICSIKKNLVLQEPIAPQ